MQNASLSRKDNSAKGLTSLDISEAALIARDYGYFVTQGRGGLFIQRKRDGDGVALIRDGGEIVPYADDYNAQDHLVARALAAACSSNVARHDAWDRRLEADRQRDLLAAERESSARFWGEW